MALLLVSPVASAAGTLANSAITHCDVMAAAVGAVALLSMLALIAFVATIVHRLWRIRQDVGLVYIVGPEPRPPHKKRKSEGRLKRWLRMTEVMSFLRSVASLDRHSCNRCVCGPTTEAAPRTLRLACVCLCVCPHA